MALLVVRPEYHCHYCSYNIASTCRSTTLRKGQLPFSTIHQHNPLQRLQRRLRNQRMCVEAPAMLTRIANSAKPSNRLRYLCWSVVLVMTRWQWLNLLRQVSPLLLLVVILVSPEEDYRLHEHDCAALASCLHVLILQITSRNQSYFR